MTEHYTTSDRDANLWPDALNVATELHNSMVEAQCNVYTWWYIKRSYGPITPVARMPRAARRRRAAMAVAESPRPRAVCKPERAARPGREAGPTVAGPT